MRRPISIWIAQIIIGGYALLYGSLLIRGTLTGLSLRNIFGILLLLSLILLWGTSLWGLIRKRIWGRWLGLVSLLSIWAILIHAQINPPNGPIQRYEFNNDAQRAGASFARIAIHVFFILLMLLVAFSKKVNRYFRNTMNDQAGVT